jgi:hypothetical protein
MTVEVNLKMGAYIKEKRATIHEGLESVYLDVFTDLERKASPNGWAIKWRPTTNGNHWTRVNVEAKNVVIR